MSQRGSDPREQEPGTDTPTGTDEDAEYDEPGFEDKSLGQAVDQDEELVEQLLDETGGDVDEAEERFDEESAGSPAIERQRRDEGETGNYQDRDT